MALVKCNHCNKETVNKTGKCRWCNKEIDKNTLTLMKKIKKQFDPKNILKVGVAGLQPNTFLHDYSKLSN